MQSYEPDSTLEDELTLGKLIMSKFPGMSPYAAVMKAKEQLYPTLKLDVEDRRPLTPDALAALAPAPEQRYGLVRYSRDYLLNKSEEGKRLQPASKPYWEAGVLGHEILGHGGDIAMFPQYYTGDDHLGGAADPHFLRGNGSPYDGIRWLIQDTQLRLKSDQELQQARAKDLAEARRRGLPTNLPMKAKWE